MKSRDITTRYLKLMLIPRIKPIVNHVKTVYKNNNVNPTICSALNAYCQLLRSRFVVQIFVASNNKDIVPSVAMVIRVSVGKIIKEI